MTSSCLTPPAPPASWSRLPGGFVLHRFDRVGSTNDEASRLARAGAPTGTVVVAREQSKGRGRLGRQWYSPPGNLYASIVIRPECPLAATSGLSLLAGVALGEALTALGPKGLDLGLKWPNDVLIGGAKTAGILLESTAGEAGRTAFVIIGAGVNIRRAPGDTPYPVTSLAAAGFGDLAPLDLLETYTARLAHWLDRWQREGFADVRDAWRARAQGIGERVRLRLDRDEIVGLFVDLTEGGALVIEQADGRRREVAAGDVIYPGP